MVKSHLAVMLS